MTGFGSAEGPVGSSRVAVEVRTVNHRFFTPALKLPPAFARWETDIRELLRRRISRGHVTVTLRIQSNGVHSSLVDEARFAAYVAELRSLAERHGLTSEIDLATILRLPGVVSDGGEEQEVPEAAPLLSVVDQALNELSAMRRQEGNRLAAGVLERVSVIEAALARIADRAPQRVREQHERTRQNVRELLAGAALDEQRLAQEIAILAERLDVAEELDRFAAHIAAFRATLSDATGEPVGKRLGFLMQDMLREANTAGSKANDSAMLSDVVTIKEELERIREQVENLE